MERFETVKEYLAAVPKPARTALEQLRRAIRKAAPKAEEVISYNMPAFRHSGIVVWCAAFKNHVGFYPKASAIVAFKPELAGYKTSKGAIQFPLDRPIPTALVKKIVRFRVRENEIGRKTTRKRKSSPIIGLGT
jgi:uncharacterized protein YdhG (YjbR/CyaY superfamily)